MFGDKISENKYKNRREIVFIFLAGLFVGSLAMLNILGLSRLIDLSFTFGCEKTLNFEIITKKIIALRLLL